MIVQAADTRAEGQHAEQCYRAANVINVEEAEGMRPPQQPQQGQIQQEQQEEQQGQRKHRRGRRQPGLWLLLRDLEPLQKLEQQQGQEQQQLQLVQQQNMPQIPWQLLADFSRITFEAQAQPRYLWGKRDLSGVLTILIAIKCRSTLPHYVI
jgi:hypothetical protein